MADLITILPYLLTILALLALIRHLMVTYDQERQQLLDRIMARNLVEYKEQTTEPVTYEPVDNSEEAEWVREQEARKI